MKEKNRKQRGIALIAAVLLLILLGLFLGVGFSVTRSDKVMMVQENRSAEAMAIATAGANWYMAQLVDDTDWSNNAAQPLPGQAVVTRNFAGGTFTITVSSATAANVTFTSTGSFTVGTSPNPIKRFVTMTAVKS